MLSQKYSKTKMLEKDSSEHLKTWLFEVLLLERNTLNVRDRDAVHSYPFSNFEEYYQFLSKYPFIRFNDPQRLFFRLIRNYFLTQLKHHAKRQNKEKEFQNIIDDMMKEHGGELVAKFQDKFPRLSDEIKAKNSQALSI